jgi:hypothetical protein
MTRIKETTVYKFEELSDKAKERARDKWREHEPSYDWWDATYEDAVRVAEILGIEIKQTTRHCVSTGTIKHEWDRTETAIYFSGFCSQGDGACFDGTYRHAAEACAKIREYAPKDETLHRIADELARVQSENKHRLCATVKHRGHYSHEFCTDIDVWADDAADDFYAENEHANDVALATQEEVAKLLRAFMKWIYRQLEAEYEYQTSDEAVSEALIANEYEFDEQGNLE